MQEIQLNGYTATAPEGVLRLGTWNSYGVEQLRIVPGDGWKNLTITATFVTHFRRVRVVVPPDGVIDVPQEATARRLYGGNPGKIVFTGVAQGVQRITTNLYFTVGGHAPTDGDPTRPTPDAWAQFVSQMQSIVNAAVPPDGPAGTVLTKTEAGNAWQEAPGQSYTIGSGLKLDEASRTLSVDTADGVEQDNTRPITSAAVFTTVGNIEVLLSTI